MAEPYGVQRQDWRRASVLLGDTGLWGVLIGVLEDALWEAYELEPADLPCAVTSLVADWQRHVEHSRPPLPSPEWSLRRVDPVCPICGASEVHYHPDGDDSLEGVLGLQCRCGVPAWRREIWRHHATHEAIRGAVET